MTFFFGTGHFQKQVFLFPVSGAAGKKIYDFLPLPQPPKNVFSGAAGEKNRFSGAAGEEKIDMMSMQAPVQYNVGIRYWGGDVICTTLNLHQNRGEKQLLNLHHQICTTGKNVYLICTNGCHRPGGRARPRPPRRARGGISKRVETSQNIIKHVFGTC